MSGPRRVFQTSRLGFPLDFHAEFGAELAEHAFEVVVVGSFVAQVWGRPDGLCVWVGSCPPEVRGWSRGLGKVEVEEARAIWGEGRLIAGEKRLRPATPPGRLGACGSCRRTWPGRLVR